MPGGEWEWKTGTLLGTVAWLVAPDFSPLPVVAQSLLEFPFCTGGLFIRSFHLGFETCGKMEDLQSPLQMSLSYLRCPPLNLKSAWNSSEEESICPSKFPGSNFQGSNFPPI